jgi:hypothetical protein
MTPKVLIRLTPEQAQIVMLNADGWLDAGACKGGLSQEEREALKSLCEQINTQLAKGASK